MTDQPCPTCNQPHPGCAAHSKQHGGPCGRRPAPGFTVCAWHGAKAPAVRAKAKQRLTEAQARADVARFAARTDIHPAEALLELVQYQAGVVAYWRTRVEQVEDDDLTWGKTRVKTGGDDRGTTNEAKPHVAYTLLREAQHDLAQYAAAALKAGVEQRRIELAERQGSLVAGAVRAILERLNLTPAQAELVPVIVPEELRRLTDGGVK